MTTKEKALELYNNFSDKANSHIEGKRCALLCIEEIIDYTEDLKQEIDYDSTMYRRIDVRLQKLYEVRELIEKL